MSYIPALRYNFLTRFYDPVLRVTLREQRLKQLLVKQVALCSGHVSVAKARHGARRLQSA